ncbi:hypothetical protein [Prauserella cavernicola]|uniref:Uncharacterized protein n=1 Tax=Prauserella cavernicola TaxID=2800127 RepID=A0A934QW34_9PSEU|nr:hypothetical protein [Prauserella cavernicola]MBK1786664.1 hypothetical protein [Prauserella cavernicola]
MVKKFKRQWQLGKVRSGDGSALAEFRLWQLFARSLFFLELPGPAQDRHLFAVDVRFMADAKSRKQHENGEGKSPAALYRDGVQVARSNLPATFPVPGGVIEVAASSFGLKRMRFVREDGTEEALRPHPRSQEARRARFEQRHPVASSVVGAIAIAILLVALAGVIMEGIEAITKVPVIAEHVGRFTMPIDLPLWATIALVIAGVVAATERATRLKYHWLLDAAAS